MDQPSEGKISHRPKKPLCISIIMIVLVLINTSAFSCFAIYKYQMEETSPVGRYLVSQYYMFTNLDPHRNKSCRYNAEEELECDFYIPRGAFMRPQGDDDDAGYYEEAESAQAKSKRKTTKSSVVKHKKKGLGTNRTTTTDSSRNTGNVKILKFEVEIMHDARGIAVISY